MFPASKPRGSSYTHTQSHNTHLNHVNVLLILERSVKTDYVLMLKNNVNSNLPLDLVPVMMQFMVIK